MIWTEIKYKKADVDRAGKILVGENSSSKDIDRALDILDNWRSSHNFPLHIFKKRLKVVSVKIDSKALVVQRLKRTPAIIKKLKRQQTKHMNLSQMQDIGGCRSIVDSVKLVRKLCDEYYHINIENKGKHCDLKHYFKNKKDYIANPKPDGYRSIHLIYKYNSDKKQKKYNGLLIEIQVRSKLQHYWATAIETVSLFTKQALKSNEGERDWKEFFKLISSVFANMEQSPIIPKTPKNESELFNQIKNLSDKLKVIQKIQTWARLVKIFENFGREHQKSYFYLLDLNIDTKELFISSFEKAEEKKANIAYSEAEKKASKEKLNKDIVLVEADTTKDLKKAYPNYYLDTNEFLSILRDYLEKRN
jgi:ppGpp synthetase/RelA/SpoT-type nucleotidyltranferase